MDESMRRDNQILGELRQVTDLVAQLTHDFTDITHSLGKLVKVVEGCQERLDRLEAAEE